MRFRILPVFHIFPDANPYGVLVGIFFKISEIKKDFQSNYFTLQFLTSNMSGGHNKGFRNDREIECSRCGKHICWKNIEEHWITYQNGGKGHPKHTQNAFTVKYYELQNGKAIKTQSIMAMFGFKSKDESLVSVSNSSIKTNNVSHTYLDDEKLVYVPNFR